ncbi:MAG: tetratricopeptide repeat protein [Nitrospirae bacterium]|nr:tetratricopeptide repeat protein [Nitrospirota bacterium]
MDRSGKVKYAIAGLVSLITFAVYLRALQNDFVILDDDAYVFENLHIRSLDLSFLRWAFLDFYASNWHPLTWISHAVDYAIWGLNPFGHHLTSIILHGINTLLVVLLMIRLLEAGRSSPTGAGLSDRMMLAAAGTTGLLFGLHPLHVESVVWISERKDLLCAFFFLLSIMEYTKYVMCRWSAVAQQRTDSRRQKTEDSARDTAVQRGFITNKHYLMALGLFILALMSKPMAVTLPVVLLILDWFPFHRIVSLKTLRSALIEKSPFFVLSLISSLLTIRAQHAGGALVPIIFVPLSTRVLVAVHSLLAYLSKMAVPVNLTPYYPLPEHVSLFSSEYFLAIVMVIGISVACIFIAKTRQAWLSAWSYYLITLLPVIGIVQVGGQAMADRYTYLPSLGPFVLAGYAAAWMYNYPSTFRKKGILPVKAGGIALSVVMLVLMAQGTYQQIGVWKNSLVVLNYILEKEPHPGPHVYRYRGLAFEKAGERENALHDYDRAIALDPSYVDAYNDRGLLHWKSGRGDKAIADFRISILLRPSSKRPYFHLGVLYTETALFDQAIENFSNSIALDPAFADAYANRGVAYALSGRPSEALADFQKALQLNDRLTDVYVNRGKFYLITGRKELAVDDFQKACTLGDNSGCSALNDLRRDDTIPQ